jgi:hypothetical protein
MIKKHLLLASFWMVLILTGCSSGMLLDKNPKSTVDFDISKMSGAVFYAQKDSGDVFSRHNAVYKRFMAHFGKTTELKIVAPSPDQVVKFSNEKEYYFRNKKSANPIGLILSNGKDRPIIINQPEKYIEEFEKFFEIPFRDKVYQQERKEKIKKQNTQKAVEILNDDFELSEAIALKIRKNPHAMYYPRKKLSGKCKKDKVTITYFKDASKKKKTGTQTVESFDKNFQIIKSATFKNRKLISEIYFYRNGFSLIDSIVSVDSKGVKSKSIYKYHKTYFAVLTVEDKNIALTDIYYLDPDSFLPVKGESYNDNGEMKGFPKYYKYDTQNRITEETEGANRLLYEYENPEEENYSHFKSLENGKMVSENIITVNKKKEKTETRYNGKAVSKIITRANTAKCMETSLEYKDGKFNICYESIYQ